MFLILHIALVKAIFGAPDNPHEITAIYRLSNQPTGTYRESEVTNADGVIETTIDSALVFNRLGSKLELKTVSHYFETGQGRLIRVTAEISGSAQTTRVEGKVGETNIEISTTVGGKSYSRTLSFTGTLLGPRTARQYVLDHLHSVGDSAQYQTFLAEFASVATVTDKLLPVGNQTVGKIAIPGMKLEQTFSTMAGKSTLWLDRKGWLLSQTIPSPLGEIVASRSTGGDSSVVPKGSVLPSETFTRSIITSNIRLPEERLIDEIKLKIVHKHQDLGWPEFGGPNQTVLSKTSDAVVLQITRPLPSAIALRPAVTTPDLRQYLAPNALLQSDDPTVRAIAAKVVNSNDDAWTAIRKLQRWTNENMHFDLGVAVVPASEVAKNRGGTCFGYSMLLGSLARAVGVPSRLRMGFVYAGGIWGGHAWVDVLIGKQWIPVDGALYSPGPADAARFSCFTGSLQENTLTDMSSLAQLFGNIDVKIIEYTVAGRHYVVPERAKAFFVTGGTFTNPWLGVSISKPKNFHYTAFNLTWPLATVVSMSGPSGQHLELKNESASLPTSDSNDANSFDDPALRSHSRLRTLNGRQMLFASVGAKAAVVLRGHGSVWVVEARGPHSERNVIRAVQSIRLDHFGG